MAELAGAPAHQFDDVEQQHEASTLGMWIFLATEVMFFGGLLLGYLVYRFSYPDAFAQGSRHLDLVLGSVNTAVLLLSSFTMALAVHSAQTGRRHGVIAFLLVTALLGCVFLGIKGVEYGHKFEENLVPVRGFALLDDDTPAGQVQLFFGIYFTLTGVHALHLIIGVGALGVLVALAWRGRFSSDYYTPVEMTGLYWHFVDIVWVFLFPLLYLIGGR